MTTLIVPPDVAECPDIPPTDKLVFGFLRGYLLGEKRWPSMAEITCGTGLSLQQVEISIERLTADLYVDKKNLTLHFYGMSVSVYSYTPKPEAHPQ